jgi:hypothetical protein
MSGLVTFTGGIGKLLLASRNAGCTVEQTPLFQGRVFTELFLNGRLVGQITPSLNGYGVGVLELNVGLLGMSGVVQISTALIADGGEYG